MSKDTVRLVPASAAQCGTPRTSPDAAARTPVSFDKVRGRHPPPEPSHLRATPPSSPASRDFTPDARRRLFRLGKMTGSQAQLDLYKDFESCSHFPRSRLCH